MTDADPGDVMPDEDLEPVWDKVGAYRVEMFTRMGFDDFAAHMLAVSSHADVHEAQALIAAGCPLALAYEICF